MSISSRVVPRCPVDGRSRYVPVSFTLLLAVTKHHEKTHTFAHTNRPHAQKTTDRKIGRTPEHEGRLAALVMPDLSRRLAPVTERVSIVYHLMGPDGGTFRYGAATAPLATLTMDTVDCHSRGAHGRYNCSVAMCHSVLVDEFTLDACLPVARHEDHRDAERSGTERDQGQLAVLHPIDGVAMPGGFHAVLEKGAGRAGLRAHTYDDDGLEVRCQGLQRPAR